ncbi:MAG: hydroxyacid dehydrogenase [Clostridia bacterium]|nr:hydroxyacid dehydrogenase [Clostridia bacterium]
MKALVAIQKDETFDTFFTKDNIAFAESLGEIIWHNTAKESLDKLKEKIKDCDTYITCWGSPALTPEILECGPKLKLLTHLGSTVAPVVCDEVYERGIKVISGFDYFSKSTAEGTIAYMLAAMRNIPFYSHRLKEQKIWCKTDDNTDSVIYKKVGLVGYGGVGRYVAKMLSNFDVSIKVSDRIKLPEEDKKLFGFTECSMEEIFETCDIISIHLAYNNSTHHIIDDALLSKIKTGALLVNTSRGAVIDEAAMIKHLQNNDFNAALDVYEQEPINMDNPLLSLPNVLMLPHQAGVTVNLRAVLTHNLLQESADFIDKGIPVKNEISAVKATNMSKF